MAIVRFRSALATALAVFLSSCQGFHTPTNTIFQARSVGQTSSTQVYNLFGFLNEGKKALVKKLAGDYDADAVQDRIDGLIKESPVLMLSFTTCPFCLQAKEVLESSNTKFTVVELDTDPEGKAIRAELADLIGRTSVPAIWIDGEFIGGCNDGPMGGIMQLKREGRLDDMLRTAGAI